MIRTFVICLMLVGTLGCYQLKTTASAPSGSTLEQVGSAEVPAKVEATTSGFAIPAGTEVTAREDVLTFQIREPTYFKIENETITAATAFSPPSESEKAAGKGIQVMFYAGIAAILGGLALFGFAHNQSGLWISAGGVCLIVAAKIVSMPIFGYLAIGCIGAGIAFFAAWYILKARDDSILQKEGLIKPTDVV